MKKIIFFLLLFILICVQKGYTFSDLDKLTKTDSTGLESEKDDLEGYLFLSDSDIFDMAPISASFKNNLYTDFASSKFSKNIKFILQEELLFENNQLTVKKLYPNPASSFAMVDYSVLNTEIKAKITVSNLLGKVIGEYDLLKSNRKIRIPTIDYDAGVYFYTLSINGKAIRSKKLIVKHN